jgi:hypothetical protein
LICYLEKHSLHAQHGCHERLMTTRAQGSGHALPVG